MPRDLRRQAAKRGGEHVGQRDHGQQSTANFAVGMTRTRDETLDEKRHKKKGTEMREEDVGVTATVCERSLAHASFRFYFYSPGRAPTSFDYAGSICVAWDSRNE